MKIDWQDYEDGAMSEEARQEAERRLKTDSKAQAELSGLRSFRKAVRQAGMNEKVPVDRLEGMLSHVASQQPVKPSFNLWVRRFAVPTLTAAALILTAWIAFGPSINRGFTQTELDPKQTTVVSNDPVAIQAWAIQATGMDVPRLTLSSMGGLQGAHCGDGYVCWDFKIEGELYHIAVREDDSMLKNLTMKTVGGDDYYVGSGIGWKCSGYSFYVVGGTETGRWKVAETACREVRSARY